MGVDFPRAHRLDDTSQTNPISLGHISSLMLYTLFTTNHAAPFRWSQDMPLFSPPAPENPGVSAVERPWCSLWLLDRFQQLRHSRVKGCIRGFLQSVSQVKFRHPLGATHQTNGMNLPIHPGRLTRTIIMEVWKIIFLSKWVICRWCTWLVDVYG